MTDQQLLEELHQLGLDRRNARVVACLPLIHVAWADGKIQKGERNAILDIAAKERLADAAAQPILEKWLTVPPTHDEVDRACDILRELARRNGGLDTGLTPEKVDTIVGLCRKVAAAGGLLGLSISNLEKVVIDEMAASLKVAASEDPGADWGELLRDLATGRLTPDMLQ